MKRMLFGVLVLLLLSSGLLSGCGGTKTTTPQEVEVGTITIGYIGGLTGPAAYLMTDALRGAQVAAWTVNESGGIKIGDKTYNVEIVSYDDEMNPAKTVAGLNKLKDEYDVSVVVSHPSGTVMSLLEFNEELEVLITGFFQLPDATEVGNKLVLRHIGKREHESSIVAQAAFEVWGARKYAIIADSGSFGKDHSQVFIKVMEQYGAEMVALEWVDMAKDNDFRPQLTRIKASNPDIVLNAAGYDEASALAFIQGRELGITVPFIFTNGFQQQGIEMVGINNLEGTGKAITYVDYMPPPIGVKNYLELFDKYKAERKWSEPPSLYGGIGYENVWAILYAMQKAGTIDDAYAIRKAAPEIIPVPEEYRSGGLMGWDEAGDGLYSYNVSLFKAGERINVFEIKDDTYIPLIKLY